MPAHRLPRGEPSGGRWVGPKSKCPSCNAQLLTRDLVPVFNWLLTRGKCHYCGTKISKKYLFIEASCAALSLFLYSQYNFSDNYLLLMVLSVCCVILLSTDLYHAMLPKQIIVTILIAGVAYRILQDGELFHMVNSTVASLLACFAFKGISEQRGGEIKRYDMLLLAGLSGIWINEPKLLIFFVMVGLCYGIFKALKATRGIAIIIILPLFINIVWDVPKLLKEVI